MLQLRIVAPQHVTDQVLRVLDDATAATNVVVLRGVARKPSGDLVECEVSHDGADGVLDALDGLRNAHGVSVTMVDSEEVPSPDALDGITARRDPDEGIVWTEVLDDVTHESRLSVTHCLAMAAAAIIAAIGIVQDQPLLIVGAMVISPDYYPVAATSLGLAMRRRAAAGPALLTLVIGLSVAVLAACLGTLALQAIGVLPSDLALGARRATLFIAEPDALTFVVAVVASVAGMLAITRSDARTLVGVFVSVTTIPAAGNMGVALAAGDTSQFWSSGGQLALNVTGLVAAGAVTAWIQLRRSRRL
jgi:uncharacterized hydrophobic protein (TIGR00271 family)